MKININLITALAALGLSAEAAVTIDANSSLRKIDGFGFSQAFGRAKEFQTAPSGMQKQALDYLFSTTTGAGFTIIRNRIGSGGSGDSIEPSNPGSPSATPKYTWDNDDSGQVWFTKQAVAYGVKTIYADAWSAPGFMKTSGNEATAGYLCGSTGHSCSSGDWRQAYANFLVQYVKYYAQIGIKVTHLGFLNEPDYKPGYSQMQISSNAQEAISFIPTLSKTVKAAGLDTVIACCDPVGWPTAKMYTPNLVNAGMEQYLGVMTSHTYSGDANSKLDTKLPVWVTESGTGDASRFVTTWYSNGAAGDGLTWANKIATGMIDAGLSAYLYWEGFENKQTQSGSHLVDTLDGSTATPNAIFWAFAMWSRHIRPGASALSVSGSISGVKTGAFKNTDGTVVIVYTNSGASQQTGSASLSGFTPGTASAWLTDNSHTFASTSATISGSTVNVNLPARSVVTVKLSSGGSSQPPSSTLKTSTSQATSATRTSASSTSAVPTAGCAKIYDQCGGGQDYTGPKCCVSSTCKFSNEWYSQCL